MHIFDLKIRSQAIREDAGDGHLLFCKNLSMLLLDKFCYTDS